MTNEIDIFTCNNVLYADILGFSNLILSCKEKAESDQKKFHGIIHDCFKEYDGEKIFFFIINDSVIAGFKDIKDATSCSKTIFHKTFDEEIKLRGAIGIGDFTYNPSLKDKSRFTIGRGLILSTFADKYHVKGHTLLLICESNKKSMVESEPFNIKGLPNEFKAYIVPWWERSKSKSIREKIKERTHGLTCETVLYLEKTKEHMDYFTLRDSNGFGKW